MRFRALKYLCVLTLPALAILAFHLSGIWTFLPVLEGFFVIPLLELLFSPSEKNLAKTEEDLARADPIYDWMVYLVVPIQILALGFFLNSLKDPTLTNLDITGRVLSMGMLCGVMGINVAHELGHRTRKHERFMSKLLLLTSLYMHFYIEHNRGHHRHVSTPDDPATARKGEMLFFFWIRSIVFSYISAWRIERARLGKKGQPFFSVHNEMIRFQIFQILLVTGIIWFFGLFIGLMFLASAIIGWLLLETVQYIEHYGLMRQKKNGVYERVLPAHSWNSNHVVGRLMLFELSRHSDHHYLASRKYQILRHMEDSPQMPTGYPGMMLLAAVPPLWFRIMDKRIPQSL